MVEQDLLELKYVAKTKLNLARHHPVQSNGLNLLLNNLTPTENPLDKKRIVLKFVFLLLEILNKPIYCLSKHY